MLMRKSALSTLIVLAAIAAAVTANGGSATVSKGSITVQGVASPSIVVTPPANSTNVDLSAGFSTLPAMADAPSLGPTPVMPLPTEATIPAGTVVVRANSLNGFTMMVQSGNGAALGASTGIMASREPGNNNVIRYTVNLGGRGIAFSNGVATGMDRDGPTPPGGLKVPVTVTVHLSPLLQAGTYSDVLSFVTRGK